MRIVHTEASCGWGGQEIRILNEARGMQALGHRVSLVCPPQARIYGEARAYGIEAVALDIGRKNLSGILAIRHWISEQSDPIDVINTHSSTDSWLVALALATSRHPARLVRTRHISAPVSRGLATRWLYARASAMVVTTGQSLRQTLIEELTLDPLRVVSIPTGIDLRVFHVASDGERRAARTAIGATNDAFVVGIVATLRSWKGHRFLVEAIASLAALVARSSVRLVIVGDGPQRAALEAQVASLGLEAAVTFAGNQTDVVAWLHAFDAFVLPSYANEGVPQALLQAMACGIPVVTTQAGAIGEIATDETTALVVAQQDSEALALALARLHDDPALAQRIAMAACALVTQRHGIEAMISQMEGVFRQAITPRRT